MNRFLNFIGRHAKGVIVVVAVLTLIMLGLASRIVLNADYNEFLPWGDDTDYYQGGVSGQSVTLSRSSGNDSAEKAEPAPAEKTPQDADAEPAATDSYTVYVEGEDIYTVEKLNLISSVIKTLEETDEMRESSSALDFITFEKIGSRLGTVPVSPDTDGVWTEEEAPILHDRIMNDPIMPSFLVSIDKHGLVFSFPMTHVSKERLEEFGQMVQPLRDAGLKVVIHGGAVLNQRVFDYLQLDLVRLVILCLIVILIVFFLCFRTKRSVLIPMSLSIISLIWTFGTMVLLGMDINLLNIITPCMVITLGSAYSIHVLNEYFAGLAEYGHVDPIESTKRISKTIVLACITDIGGFLCLCISDTQGLVEFGISVSIGVTYCAILACTYLPALMILLPEPKKSKVQAYKDNFFGKFIGALARTVSKFWPVFIIVLIAVVIAFAFIRDDIPINSNYMSYFPEDDPFWNDSMYLSSKMQSSNPFEVTITAPEGSPDGYFLKSENLTKVWQFEEAIKESPDITQIISFPSYVSFANRTMTGEEGIPASNGLLNLLSRYVMMMRDVVGDLASRLISDDGNSITLTIQNWDSVDKDLMTIASGERVYEKIVEELELLPEGTEVAVHGYPIISIKFSERLMNDMNISTVLSFAIVFIIGLITFRSLRSTILILIPVMSGIMINYIFMYILDIPFDIVTVCFSSAVIGTGCDYAIHYMLRLRRNMLKHNELMMRPLIEKTLMETGRPIFLSTASIVAGMMMLTFASYTPIRYFGMLMSISLVSCMVSTLIFMPPVAIVLDKIGHGISSRRLMKPQK